MSVPELQQRFAHSALWSIIGNASQRFGQWAILIALAKLGGVETIGVYALALAACNPLMMLSYLQLGTVLAADSSEQYPFAYYWQLRVLLCVGAAAVIVCLAFTCGVSSSELSVISVLALAKVAEGLSDIRHGLLKRADRMDLLALTQCVRAVVTLVLFVTTFSLTGDLFRSVLALACGWVACLVLIDVPLSRAVMSSTDSASLAHCRLRFGRKQWWPLAVSAIPLGLISLVVSLYAYLPQYLLKAGWGEAQLGIFVAVVSLPIVLETIARSVAQATIPRFAAFCANGDATGFRRLYRKSLAVFVSLGSSGVLIAWLWGEQLLRWLFSPELARHQSLLLVMTLAAAASFLCSYASIFITLKQYVAFLKLWSLSLSVLAALGLLLIPVYGVHGAAWAVVGSNLIRIALIHHSIYKLLRISFVARPDAQQPPSSSVMQAA
ncbi:MAG: oligosaccharide flippase family protein [Pirellulales bacterium]|nr:oligosaccharide flippase family protein [Pirellulales bacterium]